MRIVMILLFVSVWMRPSFGLHCPRTVMVLGRPARSSPNFSSKASRNSSLSRSARNSRNGKAAALRDLRIVGVDLRPRLGAHEAGNDEKLERLARERSRLQGFEVERA
jgi:hypothetical protein